MWKDSARARNNVDSFLVQLAAGLAIAVLTGSTIWAAINGAGGLAIGLGSAAVAVSVVAIVAALTHPIVAEKEAKEQPVAVPKASGLPTRQEAMHRLREQLRDDSHAEIRARHEGRAWADGVAAAQASPTTSIEAGYDAASSGLARITIMNTGTKARFQAHVDIVASSPAEHRPRVLKYTIPWLESDKAGYEIPPGSIGTLTLAETSINYNVKDLHGILCEITLLQFSRGGSAPLESFRWLAPNDLPPCFVVKLTVVSEPPLETPFEREFSLVCGKNGGVTVVEGDISIASAVPSAAGTKQVAGLPQTPDPRQEQISDLCAQAFAIIMQMHKTVCVTRIQVEAVNRSADIMSAKCEDWLSKNAVHQLTKVNEAKNWVIEQNFRAGKNLLEEEANPKIHFDCLAHHMVLRACFDALHDFESQLKEASSPKVGG